MKKFAAALLYATVIVSVLFFFAVMAKAPMVGKLTLSASYILFYRNLWVAMMGLFGFATVVDKLRKK